MRCSQSLCIRLNVLRISKLELVDEYEELDLVLSHYAVAWAANTTDLETIGLS
jgi:hypothetical protein